MANRLTHSVVTAVSACALVALTGRAAAQLSASTVIVDAAGSGKKCGEVAIASSHANGSKVLVIYDRSNPSPPAQEYFVLSTNGGSTFTSPALLNSDIAFPVCCDLIHGCADRTGDPGAAASDTGSLFVSSLSIILHFEGAGVVGRMNSGSTSMTFYSVSPCEDKGDKDFTAVGPFPPGTSASTEAVYVVYTNLNGDAVGALRVAHSATDSPTGSVWSSIPARVLSHPLHTNDEDYPRSGTAAFPVVIQSGASNAGRLVLFSTLNVGDPPEFTYTDTGGVGSSAWHGAQQINQYGGTPDDIVGIGSSPPLPTGIYTFTQTSGASYGDNVVAAFVGRTSSSSSNIDLFVALSTDGGATFDPSQRFRLTDAM